MGAAVLGTDAHEAGVRRLVESFAQIPAGAPVRLAKPTSNLFRARTATGAVGLDTAGLRGVVAVDPVGCTADVQGMCTYADLVAATLPHGLVPLVVPQLRTITVGGAVAGLGIESTSFRNGLPHESVLEMDVLTGAGKVVTVQPGDALFDAFPNSYGSLGYVTRLRIELESVGSHVALRHVRFSDLDQLVAAVDRIVADRSWQGERVDGLDGVVFDLDEAFLTLARWTDEPVARPSDYTGQRIYFESVRQHSTDVLSMHDYLWRWDTDWFWCSGAFGLHRPAVRLVWPRRWRRSDVYHRLVALDRRTGLSARRDRRRGVTRERVVQDVELPLHRTAEFLRWYADRVGMLPVWLCPVRLRGRAWPSYPLVPGTTYVNAGFWGTVELPPGAQDGDLNRAVEAQVTALDGHKSLYSDAFYDAEEFARLYGTDNLDRVRAEHDPGGRLTGLYDKAVRNR